MNFRSFATVPLILLICQLMALTSPLAAEKFPGKESSWHGYQRFDFVLALLRPRHKLLLILVSNFSHINVLNTSNLKLSIISSSWIIVFRFLFSSKEAFPSTISIRNSLGINLFIAENKSIWLISFLGNKIFKTFLISKIENLDKSHSLYSELSKR